MVILPGESWRLVTFPHYPEGCCLVSPPGDVALEHLAFMIDRSPEVGHLAIELHVHLVGMPFPLLRASHAAQELAANVCSNERTERFAPVPHRLMADVDAGLEQQVLDTSQ